MGEWVGGGLDGTGPDFGTEVDPSGPASVTAEKVEYVRHFSEVDEPSSRDGSGGGGRLGCFGAGRRDVLFYAEVHPRGLPAQAAGGFFPQDSRRSTGFRLPLLP